MQRYKWLFIGGGIMLLAAVVSLFFAKPPQVSAGNPICSGGTCTITETTVNDFVRGQFNYTGIRNFSDGEVQLLPVGLTSPWVGDPYQLPEERAQLAAVIYRDANYDETIYAIGGYDIFTSERSEIYGAKTTITGSIAVPGWTTLTQSPLDIPLAGAAAVISTTQDSGFLYVIGGTTTGYVVTDTILYKRLNADGTLPSGAWTVARLPEQLSGHQAFVRKGYLYVVGGIRYYSSISSSIYRARIDDATGSLGTWDTDTASPISRWSFGSAIWSSDNGTDLLYLLAGREGPSSSYGVAQVSYTPFQTFSGSNPSLSSPFTTDSYSALPVPLYGHGAVQNNGVLFVTGGDQGGTTPITNVVRSALIDSDPARFGRLSLGWITSNPLPEGRKFHATVISGIGEIYVIGGYNSPGGSGQQATKTVYHGSTSGVGSSYAPSGNYISRVINRQSQMPITSIVANTILTPTNGLTLTFQYRAASSTSALISKGWTTLGNADVTPSGGASKTFTTMAPGDVNFSLLQYRLLYTTTVSNISPVMTALQINYPAPPTPTPTNTSTTPVSVTPTPTPTGTFPDFTIAQFTAPNAHSNGTPLTRTVSITITNIGSGGFQKRPVQSKSAKVGRIAIPPGQHRPSLSSLRATLNYTGTTNYFIYIDTYIDETPSSAYWSQSCRNSNGDIMNEFVLGLGLWEQVVVPIDCYISAGQKTFYAQVDTCDYLDQSLCSLTYGYVLESNENNNIAGPVVSGATWISPIPIIRNPIYLPDILKSP